MTPEQTSSPSPSATSGRLTRSDVRAAPASPDVTTPAARRAWPAACLLLAAALTVVGVLTDPGVGQDGATMYRTYAAHPGALQISSLSLHWGYALWVLPALLTGLAVRGRGRGLARAAAVLGFVALSSLPGFLVTDYYDSAFGQVAGVGTVVRAHALMDSTMWGQGAMYVPGLLAFVLALPVAMLALWRAGRISWWPAPVALAAFVVYDASGATPWGAVLAAVGLSATAFALVRAR